eukprot:7612452-Pyramimonas_sp.AAC.1
MDSLRGAKGGAVAGPPRAPQSPRRTSVVQVLSSKGVCKRLPALLQVVGGRGAAQSFGQEARERLSECVGVEEACRRAGNVRWTPVPRPSLAAEDLFSSTASSVVRHVGRGVWHGSWPACNDVEHSVMLQFFRNTGETMPRMRAWARSTRGISALSWPRIAQERRRG